MSAFYVDDAKDVPDGATVPIIGKFSTEGAAAEFIETLPEYETGRYGITGPPDDGPRDLDHGWYRQDGEWHWDPDVAEVLKDLRDSTGLPLD